MAIDEEIGEIPQDVDGDPREDLNRARRILLKTAIYVAPAVIGTLAISGDAHAQAVSCMPVSCQPRTNPCNPQCAPGGCGPTICAPANCEPQPCGPTGCAPANP